MIIRLLILFVCLAIHANSEERLPPYLTPFDIELANKKGFGNGINGTAIERPIEDMEFESSSRTDYWRYTFWPNAIVIYTLNSNLNQNDRTEITLAIQNIEQNTCVRFEPKGNRDVTSVDILVDNNECGRAHYGQKLGGWAKFGGSCRNWKVMVHEFLHTLCFKHEFERHDRDQWIDVTCGQGSGSPNTDNFSAQEMIFDYRSATMYWCDECRVPKKPGTKGCDSSIGLSVIDADKVNSLYDCRGCYGHRWKNGKNNPPSQFVGGYDIDNTKLYPCRAYINGDIIPGKTATGWRSCGVAYHGKEHFVSDSYDILTNPNGANLRWKKRTGNKVPSGAIKAGRTEGQETLYIGRCLIKHPNTGLESQVIGKIHLSSNPTGMYAAFDGKEHPCADHEVLVCELVPKLIFVCLTIHENSGESLPPYLTPLDIALANKKGFGNGINGTAIERPVDDLDIVSSSRTDYWRYTLWPNAIVIYTLNSYLNQNDRTEIALAIQNIEQKTCVRFEPKGNRDVKSVDIHVDNNECGRAHLGPTPGGWVKIGGNCRNWKIIVHEFLHTLCFKHEFERHDRDQWIDVICDTGSEQPDTKDYSPQEMIFDYRSATMYSCNDCRIPKLSGAKTCDSTVGLSVIDADKVNSLYDCRGCYGHRWKNGRSNPPSPFVGGYDTNKANWYPCRAYVNGDIIPGKGFPDWGCIVSYNNGQYYRTDYYDILTNPNGANLRWKKRTGYQVPSGAIKAGRTEGQETLYIGRCLIKHPDTGLESLVIGKIHLSALPNGMYAAFNGQEWYCYDHEVLVCE